MKRVISIILVFAIMAMIGCFAETEIDFSKYSESDLLTILSNIRTELFNRQNFNGDEFWPDKAYVCGEDLNPGIYNVICIGLTKIDYDAAHAKFYSSLESYNNNDSSVRSIRLYPGEYELVNIEEGQCVIVDRGVFAFEKVS